MEHPRFKKFLGGTLKVSMNKDEQFKVCLVGKLQIPITPINFEKCHMQAVK